MSFEVPYTAFAGDWSFTHALYGPQPALEQRFVGEVLRGTWRFDEAAVARVARVRARAEPFLDHCLAAVPWRDYAVVGFTSTFEQNIASLALARRLKAIAPGTVIVFGGANWEAAMGQELHRRFPCCRRGSTRGSCGSTWRRSSARRRTSCRWVRSRTICAGCGCTG
jgi:hypothetical protein